jgi:Tfp pilus assembly protein PilP
MLSCVTAALHSHEELFKSERRFQILPVPATQNVVALEYVPKTKRKPKKKKKKINANLGANNIYI